MQELDEEENKKNKIVIKYLFLVFVVSMWFALLLCSTNGSLSNTSSTRLFFFAIKMIAIQDV